MYSFSTFSRRHVLPTIIVCFALFLGTTSASYSQAILKQYGSSFHDLFYDYSTEPVAGTGDFFMAGTRFNNSTKQDRIHIMRVDANGNEKWTRSYEPFLAGTAHYRCTDISYMSGDSAYGVTGYCFDSVNNLTRGFIMVIDANGNHLGSAVFASNFYNGYPNVHPLHIVPSDDGERWVISGFMDDSVYSDTTDRVGFVVKMKANLTTLIWLKIYDSGLWPADYDAISSIEVVSGGHGDEYIVTGSANEQTNLQVDYLGRLDNGGGNVWTNTFNNKYISRCGIRTLYYANRDYVYVLSNNRDSLISLDIFDATTGAFLQEEKYYFLHNPLAMDMKFNTGKDTIIITGYCNYDMNSAPEQSVFYLLVNRSTLAALGVRTEHRTLSSTLSASIHPHGHDFYSIIDQSTTQPWSYAFHPEMLCFNDSDVNRMHISHYDTTASAATLWPGSTTALTFNFLTHKRSCMDSLGVSDTMPEPDVATFTPEDANLYANDVTDTATITDEPLNRNLVCQSASGDYLAPDHEQGLYVPQQLESGDLKVTVYSREEIMIYLHPDDHPVSYQVELFDMSGKRLFVSGQAALQPGSVYTIPGQVSSGVYILRISNAGQTHQVKFYKN